MKEKQEYLLSVLHFFITSESLIIDYNRRCGIIFLYITNCFMIGDIYENCYNGSFGFS